MAASEETEFEEKYNDIRRMLINEILRWITHYRSDRARFSSTLSLMFMFVHRRASEHTKGDKSLLKKIPLSERAWYAERGDDELVALHAAVCRDAAKQR